MLKTHNSTEGEYNLDFFESAGIRKTVINYGSDLRTVIHTNSGYAAMVEYLSRVAAEEALLFWKAVTELRNSYGEGMTREALRSRIKHIIDVYVQVDSPLEINISSGSRRGILDTWKSREEIGPYMLLSMFDGAQNEVFESLLFERFYMFTRSPIYERLVSGEYK